MNLTQLKADLVARGYTAQSDPVATAAAMNALMLSVVGQVTMSDVLIWAASNNVTIAIQATASTAGPLQSAAASLVLALQGGYPTLDMSSATVQGMIAAFVATNVISSAAAAALTALATTIVNYAATTYGRALDFADIIAAWSV